MSSGTLAPPPHGATSGERGPSSYRLVVDARSDRADSELVSDIEDITIAALREAATALHIGHAAPTVQDAGETLPDASKPTVATELAHVLDALVNLLGAIDLDVNPASQAGHNMHALAEHLAAGATLARSVGRDTPADPPTV